MSYILNALKKAERDRMREEPEDLDDFVGADWDPYRVEKSSNSGYKLAAAIVVVAALLLIAFYSLTGLEANKQRPVASPEVKEAELVEPEQEIEIAEDPLAEQQFPQNSNQPSNEPAAELMEEELQLPQITIAGHIYIRSGSPKNRIFVGEKTYYVGDRIEGDWVIEAINFDSLTIRSGSLSSELPLR